MDVSGQARFSLFCVGIYAILIMLPFTHSRSREEVDSVEYIVSFFVSVGAQVVGHFLCKWLDQDMNEGE